jgi:hypothetical protein
MQIMHGHQTVIHRITGTYIFDHLKLIEIKHELYLVVKRIIQTVTFELSMQSLHFVQGKLE